MTTWRTPKFTTLLGTLGCIFLGGPEVMAGEPDTGWTVNLIEENDSFIPPSDSHYTQGLLVSATSGELCDTCWGHETLSGVSSFIFPSTTDRERFRFGGFFGHSIFTPENLIRIRPNPRDRPYAGWLYGGLNLYRDTESILDKVQVEIGLVGPGAKGEEVQNWWHDLTADSLGGGRVNGWGAQLRNEPGIVLSRERTWRYAANAGAFDVDILPQVNASLGNIFTYAGAGAMARFGQSIDVDWGPPRIEPALSGSDFINRKSLDARGYAWYFLAGSEIRFIARNIFLDGNSFVDSANVDKEFVVADAIGGLAVVFPLGRLTGTYTLRTREFLSQEGTDEIVSITLSMRF